eukprot:5085094-Amphidinium_carterae.1
MNISACTDPLESMTGKTHLQAVPEPQTHGTGPRTGRPHEVAKCVACCSPARTSRLAKNPGTQHFAKHHLTGPTA